MITEDINLKQRVLVYDVDLSGELISRDLKKLKSQNLIRRQCYHKEKVRESRTKDKIERPCIQIDYGHLGCT